MPEFRYLDRAVYSPTACAFCGATNVPVIDTGVQRDVIGRLYICCKPDPTSTNLGCAEQIAIVLAWMSPDDRAELVDQLADAYEQNEQLAQELQHLDQPLVIDESDLKNVFREAITELLDARKPQRRQKPEPDAS